MAGPLTALAVGTLLGTEPAGPSRHSSHRRPARRYGKEDGDRDGETSDEDAEEEEELAEARKVDAEVWAEQDAADPLESSMKVRADTDYSGKTAVSSTPLRKPEPPPRHSSEEAAEASGKEVASATFANTMPHVEGGADYTPPKYRWTPILSGLLQPFAILLEIPGLTEHWYVRLDRSTNTPVAYQENPTWLNAALGISVSCAVIANMSLISRFLERKVLASTVTCIVALSIHDIINITIVSIFGVIHGVDDGFDYSQAFWMCVCSTVASFFTNCTLIYDIIRTNDFRNSGSGLTIKQRNLVIVVMILLAYLALGALAFKFLIPDLNFESALYFTVVSLETIGFGDIAPSTVGSRIFLFFYLPIGIFLLAITVGTTRSTLLEWTAATYKRRRHRILEAYRKRRLKREEELARRQELEKRIADFGAPTYIQTSKKPKLNIDVLHAGHIMGAEMDAQAKLLKRSETLSPLSPLPVQEISDRVAQEGGDRRTEALRLQEELQKQSAENESLYRDMQEALAREEKVENWAKMGLAVSLFVIFWVVGATVFARTEEWDWFIGFYFCFVTFTSVGYGDETPSSPAGRAFFLIWAIVGVGNVTILIAVIADGYSDHLRNLLKRRGPRAEVRNKVKHWAHSADLDGATRQNESSSSGPRDVANELTVLHNQVNILRVIEKNNHALTEHDMAALSEFLKGYMRECGMSEQEQAEVLGESETRRTVFFKAYERTVVRLLSLAAVAARPSSSRSASRNTTS